MTSHYIIAGAAIWATGDTPEDALANYVSDTGDDTLTLDSISRDAWGGQTYLADATARLIAQVECDGGDIPWTVCGVTGIADAKVES